MTNREPIAAEEFPPVSYEQWRALAEADLEGAPLEKLTTRSYEGIDIQPLYSRRDVPVSEDDSGLPGFPPFVRGARPLGAILSGWDVRQEHAHPDLETSNRAMREDVAGGVTSLLLRLDAAARAGLDPDEAAAERVAGHDGITAYCLNDLEDVLTGVPVEQVGLAIDGGAAFLPAAALLVAFWQRRGLARAQVRGAFCADPLGMLSREGELPFPVSAAMAQLADLAKWTAANLPHVTSIYVDTSPYHHAGATETQDLGFAMATAVDYLRGVIAEGMSIDAAARQFLFGVRLGTQHFLAVAKLRAARRLWSRIIESCAGSGDAGAMRIHARLSDRVLTKRDPYVNLLRNTAAVFAAGVGGAEVITSAPFDARLGFPDNASRRIARNTVLILQEEARLHRVIDPAGGSWFLDRLTQELAERAWQIFQDVEGQGGMAAAVQSGWVAQQIDVAYTERAENISRRKEKITGVSEFPNVREPQIIRPVPDSERLRRAAIERLSQARRAPGDVSRGGDTAESAHSGGRTAAVIEAALKGASIGQMSRALGFRAASVRTAPLELRPLARPFEELRDAADAWFTKHGRRPRVFLAKLGPVAEHTARATYAKNFFEAGGFAVIENDGFPGADAAAVALAASGARIAVICSSDKLYRDMAPQVARKLKSAGARTVVLAGNPSDHEAAWRTAGVDRFIHVRCDVLATLRDLLREEGVLAG